MRRSVSGPTLARSPHAPAVVALALGAAALAGGCQEEPDLLCDRVRLIWPAFAIDPSDDTSPDAGLQIDIALRTSLLPGSRGQLSVRGEQGDAVPHQNDAVADEQGGLLFTDVTVPFGRIELQLAVSNECGRAESVRTPFVWDGLGYPTCHLDIGVEPARVDALAPVGVLRAEHDDDPGTPGVALDVSVIASRPDMTVTLFAVDRTTGAEEIFEQETGGDLGARFAVGLGEGEHALRAVCSWTPAELRPSSPTVRLLVDTQAPDCELTQPASRVVVGDDVDPDQDGVQFEMSGLTGAADAVGQPGVFTVQGSELDGTAVSEDGVSTATATLILDPPGAAQELSFRARDAAGNQCQDTVTFE
jgi:hypothetical protein